jgi:hypothetical protein
MCHIDQVLVCDDIIIDENPIQNNTLWISKDTGLDGDVTATTALEDSAISVIWFSHLWILKNSNFFTEQGNEPCI